MNEELKVIISAEISDLQKGVQDAKSEINDLATQSKVSFEEFNNGFQSVGNVAKGTLKTAGVAIAGVGTALMGSVAATEEYRTAQAKLNSAFESAGSSAEVAKETYNGLYRVLGDGDVAVEASNHLAQLTQEEEALAEWTNICQGVYATFGDSLPIEGLTEAVNHTTKLGEVQGPLADALEWLGISTDSFNEKLAACNTESEREALIRETLSGKYSEAAAAYETNAAAVLAQNEAQAKLDETMAQIGETMAPIMTMLAELGGEILADLAPIIQDFAEKHGPAISEALSKVGEKIGEVISWIADHWELVSTIGTIVLAIAAAISVASTALGVYNTVMGITAVVSAPVVGVIAAIVAGIALLVAGIVLAVKHWDEIKEVVKKVTDAISKFVGDMVDKVVKFFGDLKEKAGQKIEEFKKSASEKFEAVKTVISEKVQQAKDAVVNKFNEIKTDVQNKLNAVKDLVKTIFEGITNNIKTNIETAKTIVSNIVGAIKGIFTGDLSAVKTSVANIFEAVKKSITDKLNNAKNTVKGVIDAIKGFFNFKFKWPDVPMPHFSVSPSGWKIGDLLKGSIPKLSIKWYAEGGVFDKPTLFGYGGHLGGLGERGAEAIVPLEKNTKWLNRIADMLASKQGNTPIVLEVDGKVFAQTSINAINQLTRQTGTLALNLI